MAVEAREHRRARQWGPVCRGFRVSFPDGQRGAVADIRVGDAGIELLVATGLFVRHLVRVRPSEVEAILPAARRIIVRSSNGRAGTGGVACDPNSASGEVMFDELERALAPLHRATAALARATREVERAAEVKSPLARAARQLTRAGEAVDSSARLIEDLQRRIEERPSS